MLCKIKAIITGEKVNWMYLLSSLIIDSPDVKLLAVDAIDQNCHDTANPKLFVF